MQKLLRTTCDYDRARYLEQGLAGNSGAWRWSPCLPACLPDLLLGTRGSRSVCWVQQVTPRADSPEAQAHHRWLQEHTHVSRPRTDDKMLGPVLRFRTPPGDCISAKGHGGSMRHEGKGMGMQQRRNAQRALGRGETDLGFIFASVLEIRGHTISTADLIGLL